jgi:DNA-binding transcriptional ArsR family regulator
MVGSVSDEHSPLGALSDEFRLEILALIRERPASTTELAAALRRPKGTVGYHLKVLERAGLVHIVRTRRVRAVTEKYYGVVADDLSSFGVVQTRMLEADAEHFARRLDQLLHEFADAEGRTGVLFTMVAALYSGDESDA